MRQTKIKKSFVAHDTPRESITHMMLGTDWLVVGQHAPVRNVRQQEVHIIHHMKMM